MSPTLINPAFKVADPYQLQYLRLQTSEEERLPGWLKAMRKAAMVHFEELGIPTTMDEEWRFTNVAPLTQRPFTLVLAHTHPHLKPNDLEPFFIKPQKTHRLVFVDGHFSPSLSQVENKPEGAKIGSLACAMALDSTIFERHLGKYARFRDQAFVALNTAVFQDGAFIWLPAGLHLDCPVHILNVATAPERGAAVSPRNLILAQKDSCLKIIESHVQFRPGENFTNAVTEIVICEGAEVEHCKIQNEASTSYHIATTQIHQETRSRFTSHSISLGGRVSRNNVNASLEGEHSYCLFNGLYLADDGQLVDHHTLIDHAAAHCESHEYYNGIMHGHGKGVFNGKIMVRKGAQKTSAKQTNRNLLLSDDAMIDSKPQLEIFADDVKCTHGATVGQLEEEALFYLRSRGIGLQMAKQILLHAFAGQVLDRISTEEWRSHVDDSVVGVLGQYVV